MNSPTDFMTELGRLFNFGTGAELNRLDAATRASALEQIKQEQDVRKIVYDYYNMNPNQTPGVMTARTGEQNLQAGQLGMDVTRQGMNQSNQLFPEQLKGAQLANRGTEYGLNKQQAVDDASMVNGLPFEGFINQNTAENATFDTSQKKKGAQDAEAGGAILGALTGGLGGIFGGGGKPSRGDGGASGQEMGPPTLSIDQVMQQVGPMKTAGGVGIGMQLAQMLLDQQNQSANRQLTAAGTGASATFGDEQQPFLNKLLQAAGAPPPTAGPNPNQDAFNAVQALKAARTPRPAAPAQPAPAPRPTEAPAGWGTRPQSMKGYMEQYLPQASNDGTIWSLLQQQGTIGKSSQDALNAFLNRR